MIDEIERTELRGTGMIMSILRKRDKTLILGSLTLDVILRVKKLLRSACPGYDFDSQTCMPAAVVHYNVYQAMKYCNSDTVMAAVVGTGFMAMK